MNLPGIMNLSLALLFLGEAHCIAGDLVRQSHRTIVNDDRAWGAIPGKYSDCKGGKTYKITTDLAATIDKQLPEFAKLQSDYIKNHFNEFRFQYIGFKCNNANYIIINAFSESVLLNLPPWINSDYWLNHTMLADGGGVSFWRAVFNLESSSFCHFEKNWPE